MHTVYRQFDLSIVIFKHIFVLFWWKLHNWGSDDHWVVVYSIALEYLTHCTSPLEELEYSAVSVLELELFDTSHHFLMISQTFLLFLLSFSSSSSWIHLISGVAQTRSVESDDELESSDMPSEKLEGELNASLNSLPCWCQLLFQIIPFFCQLINIVILPLNSHLKHLHLVGFSSVYQQSSWGHRNTFSARPFTLN